MKVQIAVLATLALFIAIYVAYVNKLDVKYFGVIAVVYGLVLVALFYTSSKKYSITSSIERYPKSLSAATWVNQGVYPEFCAEIVSQKPSVDAVSLAISGGGSRSLLMTTGYFRALTRQGHASNLKGFVSTVSGGSWFWAAYGMSKEDKTKSLGVSCGIGSNGEVDPKLITADLLETTNKSAVKCIPNIPIDNDILKYLLYAITPNNGIPFDEGWNYAIGRFICDYMGISSNSPIAVNAKHAASIRKRNPEITNVVVPQSELPYWIVNTTLLNRWGLVDTKSSYPFVTIPLTPLYSGIKGTILADNNILGGVLVESFAYGNTVPPPTLFTNSSCNGFVQNLTTITAPKSISQMIGASSSAFAGFLFNREVRQSLSPAIKALLPSSVTEIISTYYLWGSQGLKPTTSDSQCVRSGLSCTTTIPGFDPSTCISKGAKCYSTTAPQCKSNSDCEYQFGSAECINKTGGSSLNCGLGFFKCSCTLPLQGPAQLPKVYNQRSKIGDGGDSDNTGILSLAARGAKKILCFNNSNQFLESNPFCVIHNLFGAMPNECSENNVPALNTVQVFKTSDWTDVILPQFLKTKSTGGPVWARAKLEVIPNELHGIVGGYTTDLLIVLLQPSQKFLTQLPLDVQDTVTKGILKPFPMFETILQNPPNLVSMERKQANLLSTYADWCLSQPELKQQLTDLFKTGA